VEIDVKGLGLVWLTDEGKKDEIPDEMWK